MRLAITLALPWVLACVPQNGADMDTGGEAAMEAELDRAADTDTPEDPPADTGAGDETWDTGDTGEGDTVTPPYHPNAGCRAVESQDYDADGTPEAVTTTWYDDWGHAVRLVHDEPADGALDGMDVHNWDLDLWTDSTWDHDGDGTVDMTYTRTYDGRGQLTLESSDTDNDGDPDVLTGHTWEDGLQSTKTHDFDGDGTPEFVETYTYSDGLLVYWTWDAGGDGVDQSRSWTFDAQGHVVLDELDKDHDGEVDQRYTYVWDGDLLLEERYDTDADGVLERHFTHTYDAQGRKVRTTLDSDGDGVTDQIAEYVWSGEHVVLQRTDLDADGAWDHVVERDVADGYVVTVREDQDGDGTWDHETHYTQDEAGRPLSVEVDYGADGDIDKRTTWHWDC